MARLSRYYIKDQPQHIIQRGNNREPIFAGQQDYEFYLECLADAAKRNKLKIHAYVLMTNHVHLLASPLEESSIPKTMKSIGRKYVQYFNYHYDRTGTLWEGRYKATLVVSEAYLLTCMRYIELNPVRARIVRQPKNYPWSSFKFNALGEPDKLITPHELYDALGKSSNNRQAAYTDLFKEKIAIETLDEIRDATNKAWPLGGDKFKHKIEKLTKRRAMPKSRGRPKLNRV